MKVRLRFRCHTKGEQTGWGEHKKVGTVKLGPVVPDANDPAAAEMKAFYAATPGGSLDIATINEAALREFEVGRDYYITVEAAQ